MVPYGAPKEKVSTGQGQEVHFHKSESADGACVSELSHK